MDQYWKETVNFIARQGYEPRQIIAPAEMADVLPIGADYLSAATLDADAVRLLALHKGRYQEIDRRLLSGVLVRLRPCFANEVFVVLQEGGSPLKGNNPHIAALAFITAWANSYTKRPAAKRSFRRLVANFFKVRFYRLLKGRRVAPVYVGDGRVLAQTSYGHLIALPGTDLSITPNIIRYGHHDVRLVRYLESALRPGMTFVDVGANIGVYTLIANTLVSPKGRVVAIEAVPRLARLLYDNVNMNGFSEPTIIIDKAVVRYPGPVTLYECPHYCGGSTLMPDILEPARQAYREQPQAITVQGQTLTEMLAANCVFHADLMKIDVEGFEQNVIESARAFLAEQGDFHIILEWHLGYLSREGRARKLYDLLTAELGATLEVITWHGPQRVDFEALSRIEHADIVARRSA